MENITILNEKYENITGIGVKKIKLTGANLVNLRAASQVVEEKVAIEPVEEVKEKIAPIEPKLEPVKEEKVEPKPSFYNGMPKPGYGLDDVLNQRVKKVEASYRKEEPKPEPKKVEVEPKTGKVTEREFKELLQTEFHIAEIRDEMKRYELIFNQKTDKISELKARQAKLADSFQKTSSEDQNSKSNSEFLERRTHEMRKKENFGYLEVGQNEDPRIVQIMERINSDLTELLNMNLKVYNETKEKISKFANDKIVIEKESAKVREEIKNKSNELSEFMNTTAPLILNLIKADTMFNTSKEEGQKVTEDEYVDLTKTEDLGEVRQTISNQNASAVPRINFSNEQKQEAVVNSGVVSGFPNRTPDESASNISFIYPNPRQQVTEIHNSAENQNDQVSYFGRVA